MKNIILALLLSSTAHAVGPLINGNQINPQTAISISTLNVTGAQGVSVTGPVTASSMTATGSGFKGAGTGLTGTAASLTAGNVTTNANLTGDITSSGNATTAVKSSGAFTFISTATIQGNAFSVGGSTLVVSGGNVGIGTTSPLYLLQVSSGAAASQQIVTLTSTGSMTLNGQDSVMAHLSADTVIAAASTQQIKFNTIEEDTQGEFGTTTSSFTAKSAGKYRMDVSCYLYSGLIAADQYQIITYKNSTQLFADALVATGNVGITIRSNHTARLAAGDTLSFQIVNVNAATTISCYSATGPYFSHLEIQKVP